MIKIIFLLLCLAWGLVANAQTSGTENSPVTAVPTTPDAERARISTERVRLEAGFNLEDTACYKKILVNNCLDEIKLRRRDALADLRRQEIALNALDRKAKGAEQVKKTEEKSSPEKQQQDAEKRAAALKDFQARMDREKQKNADRADAQSSEQTNSEALSKRIKGNQDKAVVRNSKQAAAAEEVKKFNERQEAAKERRAQHDRDQLTQTKPAKPLPVPE
jgi:colicin import membrane protein